MKKNLGCFGILLAVQFAAIPQICFAEKAPILDCQSLVFDGGFHLVVANKGDWKVVGKATNLGGWGPDQPIAEGAVKTVSMTKGEQKSCAVTLQVTDPKNAGNYATLTLKSGEKYQQLEFFLDGNPHRYNEMFSNVVCQFDSGFKAKFKSCDFSIE